MKSKEMKTKFKYDFIKLDNKEINQNKLFFWRKQKTRGCKNNDSWWCII